MGLLSDAWDWITGRNKGPTSTTIPRVDDEAFARYANYFSDQMDKLASDLVSGRITVDEWQNAMEIEIGQVHTTGYTIYRGGLSELGQEDLDIIQSTIDEQVGYLDAWADELRGMDLSTVDPGTIADRGRLYLGAVNKTIQQATTASVGLPTLPAYPADGGTPCLSFCKCSWKIETLSGNGNWDCTWVLGDAEHCPGCIDRAYMYSPLMIRDGIIGG